MKKWFIGVLALLAAGCGSGNKGEQARADYNRSLGDSIEIARQEIDSCDNQIKVLRDKVGRWLLDFTEVNNPREAGSYLIYTKMKDAYPLTKTGLMARINDNGQFELVAVLNPGQFDQIGVSSGEKEARSAVVPNDQALNYRNGQMTTVMFSGKEADEVGQLIAANAINTVKLSFYNNGDIRVTNPISTPTLNMILATWQLYSDQREANRLERRAQMLHEKVNVLRAHRDRNGGLDGDTVK